MMMMLMILMMIMIMMIPGNLTPNLISLIAITIKSGLMIIRQINDNLSNLLPNGNGFPKIITFPPQKTFSSRSPEPICPRR